MARIVDALDRWLSVIETVFIAALTLVALGLGVAQVLLRYVFNTGFTSSEALFILATVAGMLFAGSRAVRDDKHVSVDLVPMLARPRRRHVLHLLAHAFALALTAYFAYCGLAYVAFVHSIDLISPETDIPLWIIYALVPVTMGAFALRYLIRIVRLLRGEEVTFAHKLPDVATRIEDGRP